MKPQILAPVGDKAMLASAIDAKADAVYFGIKGLNMRAKAGNFELSELKNIVDLCHENNVKAYLTLNSIIYDNESDKLKKTLAAAKDAKIDAIICWDFAVIQLCKERGIAFHISTQASASNFEAVRFFADLGAKAIVLARELTLEQIKEIKKQIIKHKLNIKLECFIHGAMCVSISGRCYTSQFLFKKSANRGECLQPCRREYIVEDIEKEYKLKLGNNYIMSPKDLCTVTIIEKLIEAGIDIFKIEGRNRNPEYVKTTVEQYKILIDAYFEKKDLAELKKHAISELIKVYNRHFHTGFYEGTPTADDFTTLYGSAAKTKKEYVGYVKNYFSKLGVAEIQIESKTLKLNDTIMIQGNTTPNFAQKNIEMQMNHNKIETAKKGQSIAIKIIKQVRPNDKVFIIS